MSLALPHFSLGEIDSFLELDGVPQAQRRATLGGGQPVPVPAPRQRQRRAVYAIQSSMSTLWRGECSCRCSTRETARKRAKDTLIDFDRYVLTPEMRRFSSRIADGRAMARTDAPLLLP